MIPSALCRCSTATAIQSLDQCLRSWPRAPAAWCSSRRPNQQQCGQSAADVSAGAAHVRWRTQGIGLAAPGRRFGEGELAHGGGAACQGLQGAGSWKLCRVRGHRTPDSTDPGPVRAGAADPAAALVGRLASHLPFLQLLAVAARTLQCNLGRQRNSTLDRYGLAQMFNMITGWFVSNR